MVKKTQKQILKLLSKAVSADSRQSAGPDSPKCTFFLHQPPRPKAGNKKAKTADK